MCNLRKTKNLFVFARHDLVSPALASDEAAVLLEGSWPAETSSPIRWSLDGAVDARFDWIDHEATRLAERLGQPRRRADEDDASSHAIPFAWINALALRYDLVKLIRLVAYFGEVRPLGAAQDVRLVAARGRDQGYADLMTQICRLAGACYGVSWVDQPRRPESALLSGNRWRRAAARMGRLLDPRPAASPRRRRVVLCGSPKLLNPICGELLRRDCQVWWLYDRFALRSWLRWRLAGVGQLVCDSTQGRRNRFVRPIPQRLECRGVNLAGAVGQWIADRLRTHGPQQTRLLERIDAHFDRIRPHALVLGEDATPMARAAVGLARRHGAASLVVQHGAPICRLGFAPLAADRVFVWGGSSKEQLTRWGVPPERIHVLGSPYHDLLSHTLARYAPPPSDWSHRAIRSGESRRARVLLLATVPPRDDRPDAVTLHLTHRTYAEMLRMAVAAVAKIPRAQLVVKLHPRAPDDPTARAVLAGFPWLESRVVRRGSLEKWLVETDCALSCLSSAGVDATLARVPVVQLLPAGSGDILPHEAWGMAGTARTEAELQPLLAQALATDRHATKLPDPNVLGDLDGQAGARIAEAVLAQAEAMRTGIPEGDIPIFAARKSGQSPAQISCPGSAWARHVRQAPPAQARRSLAFSPLPGGARERGGLTTQIWKLFSG